MPPERLQAESYIGAPPAPASNNGETFADKALRECDLIWKGALGTPAAAWNQVCEKPITTLGGLGIGITLGVLSARSGLIGGAAKGLGALMGAAYLGSAASDLGSLYKAHADNLDSAQNFDANLATTQRVFGRVTVDATTIAAMTGAFALRSRMLRSSEMAADALLAKPIEPAPSVLQNGAKFEIVNPKTGQKFEAIASVKAPTEAAPKGTTFDLATTSGEPVGMLRFKEMLIDPAKPTHHSTLFGNPREPKSFLWLDMMRVEPGFQGKGVRESVIAELSKLSESMGHGGRIKLEASNEFGSVSAIPWYKAGFRPQPGARFHAETFDKAAAALQAAVESKARLSPEQGRQFDGLLMFLDAAAGSKTTSTR